jgi:hypothetical protein
LIYFFNIAEFPAMSGFLLLHLKCDLLVGGQDCAYSFRNARHREDAAQRLALGVSFGETFHRRQQKSLI